MYQKTRIAVTCFLAVAAAACGDNLAEPPPEPPPEPEITYWQDTAPIFFQYCVNCHQQDGIAPFRLDSYAEAKEWAPVIREAVQARTMPPWQVTGDGSCGEFQDSQWLEDADIETIADWVELGALEGTPRTDLSVPPPGPGLEEGPGEIVSAPSPADYVPQFLDDVGTAEIDEYRCFLVDSGIDRDRFITGSEVLVTDSSYIHHVLMFVIDGTEEIQPGVTNLDMLRSYDDASPDQDGWPCYVAPGQEVTIDSLPVNWVPGQNALHMPENSGSRISAGSVFVVQVHYHLTNPALYGRSGSAEVRLRLTDEVEREGFFAMPDPFLDTVYTGNPAQLEPGKESVPISFEISADELIGRAGGAEYLEVYGTIPHMHKLGSRTGWDVMKADGTTRCGVEVNQWNPEWQYFYWYDTPVRLEPGDVVTNWCEYDTRGLTEPATAGFGVNHEMCTFGVYFIAR